MTGRGGGRTTGRGIVAAGVYVPRYRLAAEEVAETRDRSPGRGIDAVAVPSGDEDAVSTGVAAAERALANADVSPADVRTLAVATTTPPLAEEGWGPRIATALGLPGSVRTWHHGQHTAAGADALETSLNADGPALAVAADCPSGDRSADGAAFGAGAAAFLVGDDAPVTVTGIGSATAEAPGVRYREAGSEEVDSLDVTGYERSTVRGTVGSAVAEVTGGASGTGADGDGSDDGKATFRVAAVHQPDGALPYRIAGECGLSEGAVSAGLVADRVGDLGAAGVTIGLVAALESGGDGADGGGGSDHGSGDAGGDGSDGAGDVLAAWFGSGSSAVAMRFAGSLQSAEADALEGGEAVAYAESLRKRGRLGDASVAGGGANVSQPTWQRTLEARYALAAGRCPSCDALSFPGEGACDACHARVEFERAPLAREGTVAALTVVGAGGAPPEFAELQAREGEYGAALVRLPAADGDGAVTLPAQLTDCDPTGVETGDPVRRVVRRLYAQEGVPRYGAKFAPVE
ncbi:3-hydroxy-3-methylglutaryl CoA synthase [Halorarum salinum]|uniref:3-hydroxy-3-methylglutaryl CoA synthase n=1 Tax=Halorarum salinum TaxID=2743089 RepID=A0A7D5QCQ9_9EURY|nr:3-hydroxy-3-methylglutaryl CoA synthase [Halobaculum salinum]QLG63917.1 3-hydroxy-3-methylglutaryl CoA synthase [Halobaculum salinum]